MKSGLTENANPNPLVAFTGPAVAIDVPFSDILMG